jgi:hypothetical protein
MSSLNVLSPGLAILLIGALTIRQPRRSRRESTIQERVDEYREDLKAAVLCRGRSRIIESPGVAGSLCAEHHKNVQGVDDESNEPDDLKE